MDVEWPLVDERDGILRGVELGQKVLDHTDASLASACIKASELHE